MGHFSRTSFLFAWLGRDTRTCLQVAGSDLFTDLLIKNAGFSPPDTKENYTTNLTGQANFEEILFQYGSNQRLSC
jgi:hypothetical protein